MKFSFLAFTILISFSPQARSQIKTSDLLASAKEVQACFNLKLNEHKNAVDQYKERLSKNLARIEELEKEKIRNNLSNMMSVISNNISPEVNCAENPENSGSIDGKIEAYKKQNLALKLFYELNETNLVILQLEVLLIQSYISSVKLDGFEEVKLIRKVVEQEITSDDYTKSLQKQNALKNSLKLKLEFPDCSSKIKDLKKLHPSSKSTF